MGVVIVSLLFRHLKPLPPILVKFFPIPWLQFIIAKSSPWKSRHNNKFCDSMLVRYRRRISKQPLHADRCWSHCNSIVIHCVYLIINRVDWPICMIRLVPVRRVTTRRIRRRLAPGSDGDTLMGLHASKWTWFKGKKRSGSDYLSCVFDKS